jgi:replicative DNA helicase
MKHIGTLLTHLHLSNEVAKVNSGMQMGLATGLYDLDQVLCGLRPGCLYVIAGRPGMGKSSLALGIALHAALQENVSVSLYAAGSGTLSIAHHIQAIAARVPRRDLDANLLSEAQYLQIRNAATRLEGSGLYVAINQANQIDDMERSAIAFAHDHPGLKLLIADSLQRFTARISKHKDQEIRIASMKGKTVNFLEMHLQRLKALAVTLNCPILVTWELGPEIDQRKNKLPGISDMHLTHAMEDAIDCAMLLYRDEYYRPETTRCPGIATLKIPRNRCGGTGQVCLSYLADQCVFETLALMDVE